MMVRRLDENGQPCYGHGASDFVSGSDAVAVLCVLALRLNMTAWFLDASLGVRWLQDNEAQQILGRFPADVAFARSELLRVILGVAGVASVESLDIDFDHRTRSASASIVILTLFGDRRTINLERIP
jgi:hypothetical protein